LRSQARNIALQRAAATGESPDLVSQLLAQGADPNFIDGMRMTPLLLAAQSSYSHAIIADLLEHGADVNAAGPGGGTALMEQAGKYPYMADSNLPTLRLLLSKGAKLDLADVAGRTALINAVRHSNADAVKLLLEAGADTQTRDRDGKSALDYAEALDFEGVGESLKKANREILSLLRH
jgi:ankyrin repeat protein